MVPLAHERAWPAGFEVGAATFPEGGRISRTKSPARASRRLVFGLDIPQNTHVESNGGVLVFRLHKLLNLLVYLESRD